MRAILDFLIKRSFIVNLTSIFICIVGLIAYSSTKRDLIPSFKIQLITVRTILPGASAIEMEKHVTFPIEEAVKNIAGLEKVTSTSSSNVSQIQLHFKSAHENIEESVELVKSSIESIKHYLPQDIKPINIARFAIDNVQSYDICLLGVDRSNDQDRNWVQYIKEDLLKIHGIVKIETNLPPRHIFIDFRMKEIARHGITLSQVQQMVIRALSMSAVGTLEKKEKEISITLKKNNNSIQDLQNLPILANRSGNTIYLKDLANIEYRPHIQKSKVLYNGEHHINLSLYKDLSSDVLDLEKIIKERITKYQETLPKHIEVELTGNAGEFIQQQISILAKNGFTGFFLVLIILFTFLGLRISLMTAIGIPLSYLGTFIILHALGVSIDLISIVGMILVIGILVDDAIIVSEHYALNLQQGKSPHDAALDAASSTIVPVTGTILTTIVAFAPMILIKSEASEILFAIPAVVITALIFSWFESFFILPNHLQHFVKAPSKRNESKLYLKLLNGYKRLLEKSLSLRYWLLFLLIAFMVFSTYWAAGHMPKNFNLNIGSERIAITAILKKSSSLEETRQRLEPLHKYINTFSKDEVSYSYTQIGNMYRNHREYNGKRYATIYIVIPIQAKYPKKIKKKITSLLDKEIKKIKDPHFEELYSRTIMRGDEKNTKDIVTIFVSGGDKISFTKLQHQIEKYIKGTENVKSIFIDQEAMQESWQFMIDEKSLIRYRIAPSAVASQLRHLILPQELGQIRFNGENSFVYTQYKKAEDPSINDLNNFEVITADETTVPMRYLGHWEKTNILKKIKHENLMRKFEIDVRYDKEKTTKDKIAKSLEKAIAPLKKEYPAYNFSINKANEQEEKNKAWMLKIAFLCVGSILFVLAICLGSVIQPFLVAFAIPFGIIGIIWSLHFHGMELGVMAIIGLVGMAGVVVNDSLIMVDFINRIKGSSSRRQQIIDGAAQRLRPIIITTITTLGGVFPMAYGIGGESGFTQPLAFAMGWGLTFATILTLFVLPSLLEITNDCQNLSIKVLQKSGNKLQNLAKKAKILK